MGKISEYDLQQMQERTRRAINPKAAAAKDAETRAKWAKGKEADFQREIMRYCDLHSIYVLAPAFGKKTRMKVGHPDLTLLRDGKGICIETKTEGNATTADQDKCIAELRIKGVPVLVAYDLPTAIEFIREHLCL